jgi:CheY-like chemotaxis protein
MNILIIDDNKLDRNMLSKMINKIQPESTIYEASNLKEMYSCMETSVEFSLVTMDIRLSNKQHQDIEGLNALFDIVESYPSIPIFIVTGYFFQYVKRFHEDFLGKTTQIVAFLDKADYSSENLKISFIKAQDYRNIHYQIIADKKAFNDLISEAAEKEKNRLIAEAILLIHNRLALAELLQKAFQGDDWASRIEAESTISRGICKVTGMVLCIEIDNLIKSLCSTSSRNFENYRQRIEYIVDKFDLRKTKKETLHDAWTLRNYIVHAELADACRRENVQLLLRCLNLLTDLGRNRLSFEPSTINVAINQKYSNPSIQEKTHSIY